jgi:D-alanyl-D-alanine carboxypeptidase
MLASVESMAWRILVAKRYGRPSPLVLAFAAASTVSVTTNGWPTVSVSPELSGSIRRLLNDHCLRKGQNSRRAISLASHQAVLALNSATRLIPASTTKLITRAATLLRLSPHKCFRTAVLSKG